MTTNCAAGHAVFVFAVMLHVVLHHTGKTVGPQKVFDHKMFNGYMPLTREIWPKENQSGEIYLKTSND